MGRCAQLPPVHVTIDAQPKYAWQHPGQQQQPAQFVPPELTPVPDEPRSDEDGSWDIVTLEQGFGVVEVVGVTVVERDDN
jgi:hypothetical protein